MMTKTFFKKLEQGQPNCTWPHRTEKEKYGIYNNQGSHPRRRGGLQTTTRGKLTLCICSSHGYNSGRSKIFRDQKGKFPVQSSRGNKYVYFLSDYDSNTGFVQAVKIEQQTKSRGLFWFPWLLHKKGTQAKVVMLWQWSNQHLKRIRTIQISWF